MSEINRSRGKRPDFERSTREAGAKARRLFWADQFDAVLGADPGVSGHAADGVKPGWIYTKVFDQVLAHVEADDFADHDYGGSGHAGTLGFVGDLLQ